MPHLFRLRFRRALWALAALAISASPGLSAAQATGSSKPLAGQVVRIAVIDPMSGLMAPLGINQIKGFQFFAEKFSATNPAGVKFEVIGIDNKLNPTESLHALNSAIDQGVRYITQGTGSGVSLALIDAINKYNQRNPGKEVLFLNHSASDPDLTNSKCSFWHFRFDADTSMKTLATMDYIKDQPDIRKVYLFNQNYAAGTQIAAYSRAGLQAKRPDIQIVGDDLHPLAQVRDFAPYIAKIKASGADTVITGNWGSDLSLLIKSAEESGYKGRFFTYYAVVSGTPTALGTSAADRTYQVAYSHYNMGGQMDQWMKEFNQRFNDDFYTSSIVRVFEMLGASMASAGSTEPAKVAAAMEGLRIKSFNGDVEMRKSDHQLQQPLYVTVWSKAGGRYPYSPEKTGMTMVPVRELSAEAASTPTTCQMKRP